MQVVGRVLQPQGVTAGKVNIEQEYELAQFIGKGEIMIYYEIKQSCMIIITER